MLGQVEPGNEKDVYDLVIKILENYPKSEVIGKKIFEVAEFMRILDVHRQVKDSEYVLVLAGVIAKDLDYYFEHFPKLVR